MLSNRCRLYLTYLQVPHSLAPRQAREIHQRGNRPIIGFGRHRCGFLAGRFIGRKSWWLLTVVDLMCAWKPSKC